MVRRRSTAAGGPRRPTHGEGPIAAAGDRCLGAAGTCAPQPYAPSSWVVPIASVRPVTTGRRKVSPDLEALLGQSLGNLHVRAQHGGGSQRMGGARSLRAVDARGRVRQAGRRVLAAPRGRGAERHVVHGFAAARRIRSTSPPPSRRRSASRRSPAGSGQLPVGSSARGRRAPPGRGVHPPRPARRDPPRRRDDAPRCGHLASGPRADRRRAAGQLVGQRPGGRPAAPGHVRGGSRHQSRPQRQRPCGGGRP